MAPQRRRSRSATDSEEPDDGRQTAVRRQATARRQAAGDDEPTALEEPDEESQEEPPDRSQGRSGYEDEDEAPGADDTSAGAQASADGDGSVRTARDAVRAALREILDLTAKQPESIVGVQRTRDGWTVCFEVIEDRRIPSSADILATYEAAIDADGELMSFRRLRRYSRGRGDSNGGSAK
jgi:hypothetical protein